MTSCIEQLLAKISAKEKTMLIEISEKITSNDFTGLDIKKLSGHENLYRVRKGKFRIIFQITKTTTIILAIEKRTDTTYNF